MERIGTNKKTSDSNIPTITNMATPTLYVLNGNGEYLECNPPSNNGASAANTAVATEAVGATIGMHHVEISHDLQSNKTSSSLVFFG